MIREDMYIFGGLNGEIHLNDMFTYNFTNKSWTEIQSTVSPCVREIGK